MLLILAVAVFAVVFFKLGVYSVTLAILRACLKGLLWVMGVTLLAAICRGVFMTVGGVCGVSRKADGEQGTSGA